MRIVAIADPQLKNSDYRSYQPMGALSRRGHDVQLVRDTTQLDLAALLRADVVHIHRYADRMAQALALRVREAGVAVVWDDDDDHTDVPAGHWQSTRAGGLKSQRMRANMEAMLGVVDVVTTPSAVLAERFRAAGAREVRVLENYLPETFPGARAAPHDGVAIGWTAGGEHRFDLEQLGLRETLKRVLDEHDDVRVASIGLHLGLPADRYRHIQHVPFPELARHVAEFDIGIAPIADVPFNQARSDIKLKEYAAAGVPWLASPIGPYAGHGERQGGRLVPDDGWYDALKRLVERERERGKLAKRAAKWARSNTIGKHADGWERTFEQAVELARR